VSEIVDLRGRADVLRLFQECVTRPERGDRTHRRLPVIVLLGMSGSGKTAVLDDISRSWNQVVPLARLDLGAPGEADLPPREVVLQLAFQLAKWCPQFGRMPFRRLMLCLVIAGAEINPQNRRHALADVRKAVIADTLKPEHHQAITKQLDYLIQARVVPTWSTMAANVLLRGAETALWRGRLRRISGLWPRRRQTRQPMDPRELLVDLGTGAEDLVDEMFCQAFLADLRAAYRRGLRAPGRTANCAVLLDNVNSPAGTAFLELLASCRAQLSGDPLAVVATSRAWLPTWNPLWTMPGTTGDGQGKQLVRVPELASLADWTERFDGDDHGWGYLVELPNLTTQEVVDLDAAGTRPRGSRAARFAHRLTTGHPLAVRGVLDGLNGLAGVKATIEMRRVLDQEHSPDGEPEPLCRIIRRRLLGEIDNNRWTTLVSFAVADDLEVGARLAGRVVKQDAGGTAEVLRFLQSRLLIINRDGRPALDPWLRRLVLHELAKTDAEDPRGWWTMHSLHRNFHNTNQNVLRTLYHGLAIGEIEPAIGYLAERLDHLTSEVDTQVWVDQLNSITSAPNQLSGELTPADQVEQLVAGSGNVTLARLVVAKWLLSDPLVDPEESLRGSVRRGFERLAEDAPPGYLVFIREADNYV
jgi:hypothetical protein